MRDRRPAPPEWPYRILCLALAERECDAVDGDLRERFDEELRRNGLAAARRWYRREVYRSLPALATIDLDVHAVSALLAGALVSAIAIFVVALAAMAGSEYWIGTGGLEGAAVSTVSRIVFLLAGALAAAGWAPATRRWFGRHGLAGAALLVGFVAAPPLVTLVSAPWRAPDWVLIGWGTLVPLVAVLTAVLTSPRSQRPA